ncbi:hypothetical protein J5N97_004107 [Dioscorea zingiberensis]|uniref:Uncharacterized protein n=1 Tax=Dioscorea zingiberensis TaxID=325984 RepID=A0A9D5D5X3_9LILI|nr:hypothetical protein J5N97_004107 [Dioscorea zingiberensis]
MALLPPSLVKPIANLTTITRHRLPLDLNSISPLPRPFLSSFPSFSAISNKSLIICSVCSSAFIKFSDITGFDVVSDDLNDDDALAASLWKGVVVYRRDVSVTHLELS